MKTSGICGRQSARKHRQRGDYVIHLRGFPGRYTWLHHRMLAPWEEKVSASRVRQEQRAMFYDAKMGEAVTRCGQRSLKRLWALADEAAPDTQDWSEEP